MRGKEKQRSVRQQFISQPAVLRGGLAAFTPVNSSEAIH
jgi:hypothetical protein